LQDAQKASLLSETYPIGQTLFHVLLLLVCFLHKTLYCSFQSSINILVDCTACPAIWLPYRQRNVRRVARPPGNLVRDSELRRHSFTTWLTESESGSKQNHALW